MKALIKVKERSIIDKCEPCKGCVFNKKKGDKCFAPPELHDRCFWNSTIWVFKGKGA